MNNAKTRILRSTGLTSDATRIMKNARATLAGQRIVHDNSTTFAAPDGKSRTTTTTLANGHSLSYLDSAGDEQPGYADVTEAAQAEYDMRKAGKRSTLDEADLRKARRKAHVARGLSDESALAITRMSDDDLDTARHGMASDDVELDSEDLADEDADSALADALANEQRMRHAEKTRMGGDVDSDDAVRRRIERHVADGLTASESKRIAGLDDDDLANELAECGDDDDADLDDEDADEDAELSRGRVELSRSSGDVRIMFPKGAA